MPFFSHDGKLHYFAHVPKCGGQSVEAYLQQRFGPLALLDNDFYSVPENERWTNTSPQHIDEASLLRLFPSSWIASSFAVVRHPLTRLVSAYNFRTLKNRRSVRSYAALETWFERNVARQVERPFLQDNHLRLQSDLVPQDARVFKIEEGLGSVIHYLDELTGTTEEPREMPHENKNEVSQTNRTRTIPVSEAFADRVARYYAADLERFGYGPRPDPNSYSPPLSYEMPVSSLSPKRLLSKLTGGNARDAAPEKQGLHQ